MLKTSIVLHVTLIRIFEMDHYLYGFDHIYCIGCKFEVQCPPVKKGGAVKASLQYSTGSSLFPPLFVQ